MASMRKEESAGQLPNGRPLPIPPGQEYFAIELDDADVAALVAGRAVQIRVGLPPEREFHDTTFTIFRKQAKPATPTKGAGTQA
jgi:hypothetical protein